jgi:hypothetical protein
VVTGESGRWFFGTGFTRLIGINRMGKRCCFGGGWEWQFGGWFFGVEIFLENWGGMSIGGISARQLIEQRCLAGQ